MQDKDFHNESKFDEAFIDQSWANMKAMLDKEMPVDSPPSVPQGSNNYLLLLLFLAIGFAAGAGAFVVFSKPVKEAPKPPAKRLPIAQSVPIEASKLRSAPPIVHQYSSADHLIGTKQIDVQVATPSSNQQNFPLAYESTPTLNTTIEAAKSASTATTKNMVVIPPVGDIAGAEIVGAEPEASQLAPALAIDEAPVAEAASSKVKTVASFGAIAMLPKAPPNLASRLTEPAMTLAQLPKKRRLRFGATLAGHLDNKLDGAGYSVGPMLEYDLDRKFALRTGLNYSHIQHSGEGASLATFDEISTPDLGNSGSVAPLNNYSVTKVPTMDYLTLPLLLTYDLGANLKVSAGGELSYLLNADSNTSEDGQNAFNPDIGGQESRSDVKSNLRKSNIAAQIGIGYYPTDNLGFDLSYNFGLMDYTRENAYFRQFDNHKYIKFSLNYYFSRR